MRRAAVSLVALAALAVPAAASAHAELSPPVVAAGHDQLFTLVVPTEKEDAATTKVELTPPDGFTIDSFVSAPGWKRDVQRNGSGEDASVTRVTWTGGNARAGEDAAFSFLAGPESAKTYAFAVRQTYSEGSVIDWSGPEDSDNPAPVVEAIDSLGGGGGTSILSIVALVVAGLALVLAVAALVSGGGSGRRPLA